MTWKAFWKKLLFPPVWVVILLFVLSAALTPLVLIRGLSQTLGAYAVYAIAFYSLCVTSAFCARTVPGLVRYIRAKCCAHPIGQRFLTDAAFKTHVSLYMGLAVNLLYAGINVLSWALYRSMWFVVLAAYYVILAVMRFLLVRYVRVYQLGENRLGELKRARVCSCILLLLNFVLAGAVLMILYENKGFEYHGILIYAMAAYTFYIVAHAIAGLVRYRKYRSPVMTVSRVITLSAALVSMLSLETAMLSQFGRDMAQEARWLMIALTGAGVSVAVIVLSACMIVQTAKEAKEI